MDAADSVDKSWEELRRWNRSDPRGFVDYAFELQAEVRRLRDAAAQNSHNSSRPPSTDGPEQPKPKSLRKKSGRKTGGQPGHPGRTLQSSDTPKHIQVHPLRECECGEDLSNEPALDFQRRQVFDLRHWNWNARSIGRKSRSAPVAIARLPRHFLRISKPPSNTE